MQIYNNKNIKFFYKDLINVSLKHSQNIKNAKKHDLVFKIIISGLKSRFLFIIFINFYFIIRFW